jgi:hypothetical protein
MTRSAGFGARAVWMVPQVFNWASYGKPGSDRRKSRAPTLAEMRCMAWSCIAEGANGLVFYSWFDLWRMDRTAAEGGRAQTREPFEQRWADVKAMASEIRAFAPVLLSDEEAPAPRAEADAELAWRTFAAGGSVYLLCVNNDPDRPRAGRFEFPCAFASGEDVAGRAARSGGASSWRIELAPLEAHVTRLRPAGTPPAKRSP